MTPTYVSKLSRLVAAEATVGFTQSGPERNLKTVTDTLACTHVAVAPKLKHTNTDWTEALVDAPQQRVR